MKMGKPQRRWLLAGEFLLFLKDFAKPETTSTTILSVF